MTYPFETLVERDLVYLSGHSDEALRLSWSFLLRFQILFGRAPFCTHLSYPLMVWTVWVMTLPWFAGSITDDALGLVAAWGIIYKGQHHLAHEVYAAGFWDVLSFLVS